jgi:hypothetical protein
MRTLLVSKFGFGAEDVMVLTNSQASREGISRAFREHLIDLATQGVATVFFYAGYGSQVTNSLSKTADLMDESIVASDSSAGAPDIRLHELRRYINAALDRGASVTAIFDCSFRASAPDGLQAPSHCRALPADGQDARDASDPGPDPGQHPLARGLLLWASRSTQPAGEVFEATQTQGAFTRALTAALRKAPSAESAREIFRQTQGLLRAGASLQEPALRTSLERLDDNLFGEPGTGARHPTTIAVAAIEGSSVSLAGGIAAGLRAGCELRRAGAAARDQPPRLQVVSTDGPARAAAAVVLGSVKEVNAGDLFEVDVWTAPNTARLRLWLPPAAPSLEEIEAATPILEEIRRSCRWSWVADPTEFTPAIIAAWGERGWVLRQPGKPLSHLGQTLSASALAERLEAADAANKPSLFVRLPPSGNLRKELDLGADREELVEVVATPSEADYWLVGRLGPTRLEYAWVLRDGGLEGATNLPLPVRTDWYQNSQETNGPQSLRNQLTDGAFRIASMKMWLLLQSPPDDGSFPYHLALRNSETGKLKTEGVVREGEHYTFALVPTGPKPRRPVQSRHVYVFVLDSDGRRQLIFPNPDAPSALVADGALIPLAQAGFTVGPPYGMDTYFLLSTVEPLPDPTVLASDGVRSRGGGSDEATAPVKLLYEGEETRGAVPTASQWSIERLYVHSQPR